MAFVIDRTFDIQAPASVVWEVLTDFERYPEWNEFVVGCQSSLKPGEPIDLKVRIGRKPQFQREWITECADGVHFAYQMRPVPFGALSSLRSHHLESRGASSTHYHSYWHLKGWLAPLLRALIGRKLQSGFSSMNEGVRLRAEKLWRERSATAASGPA